VKFATNPALFILSNSSDFELVRVCITVYSRVVGEFGYNWGLPFGGMSSYVRYPLPK
jgi:hypothetical protein